MTDPTPERSFHFEDIRILSVRANSAPEQGDELIKWTARFYDPDPESTGADPEARILISNLHVHAESGWGNVTVGCLIVPAKDISELNHDSVALLIAGSNALESMYDIARSAMRGLLGLTDVDVDLPYKSPDANVAWADPDAEEEPVVEPETTRTAIKP